MIVIIAKVEKFPTKKKAGNADLYNLSFSNKDKKKTRKPTPA